MKLLHKKNLKEENYDFFQPKIEKEENPFSPNSTVTLIYQILIWVIIGFFIIVLLNQFYTK
jgi:hypothetical protein